MPGELENSIKRMAETLAKYVQDAATLTVETRYIELGSSGVDFDQAKPGARTILKLDADSCGVVPMRRTQEGTLEVDSGLLAIHDQNVKAAIEYRARMVGSLMTLLQLRAR